MSVRAVLLSLALSLASAKAHAQGFAGLGTEADGFAIPERGTVLQFPRDHGQHPDFRIEWWYLTANLQDADGTAYGLQWTLFRSAMQPQTEPGWNDPQLWMGHAAVTTPSDHFVAERLARGGIGQAGAQAEPFEAWIDDWALKGDFDALQMTASGSEFAYDMRLSATAPLVFHGDDGYSVKSADGQASYYYSQPHYRIEGTLRLPGGNVAVTGQAWLDREWSSQPLSENQSGWDWFSLSFDSGAKLMGFQLRQTDGTTFTSGTWISKDGQSIALPDGAFIPTARATTAIENREIPTEWRVALPSHGIDIIVSALNPQAWMATSVPYWEGPVRVEGSHTGQGYLEMTGYAARD